MAKTTMPHYDATSKTLFGCQADTKVELPETRKNLAQWLFKEFSTMQSEMFVADDTPASVLSSSDLVRHSLALRRQLIERNMSDGGVMALVARNSLLYASHVLGIVGADSVCACVVVGQDDIGEQLDAIAGRRRLSGVLCSSEFLASVRRATSAPCIVLSESSITSGEEEVEMKRGGEDGCCIVFTSGTTGRRKALELSHRELIADVDAIASLMKNGAPPNDVALAVIPLCTPWGLANALGIVAAGRRCCIVPSLPPYDRHAALTIARAIERHRVSTFATPPWPLQLLVQVLRGTRQYDLTSLRLLSIGAAPLPWPLEQELRARIGPQLRIRRSYGGSEVDRPSHTGSDSDASSSYCGIIAPQYAIRVADVANRRRLLPSGERGELLVRRPIPFGGYLSSAPSPFVDDDGFMASGDFGSVRDDGSVYVEDRVDAMIALRGGGGAVIAPSLLEALMLSNDVVADVGVMRVAPSSSVAMRVVVERATERGELIDMLRCALKHLPSTELHGADPEMVVDLMRDAMLRVDLAADVDVAELRNALGKVRRKELQRAFAIGRI